MDNLDLVRELEKVLETVKQAEKYFKRLNEGNAALHLAKKTMYSPLTTTIIQARESLERLIKNLTPEDK